MRKYDEAALWQNAVHPRLLELAGGLQPLLDRWEPYMGWAPTLVLEEPEFDDDSPRYDKVQKAQFIALTNDERRGLIGFDPLPPEEMGPTGKPIGQEIWLGKNMVPIGMPPAPVVVVAPPPAPEPGEGAHTDPDLAAEAVRETIRRSLAELDGLSPAQLADERYQKFRRMGAFFTEAALA